MLTVIVGQVAYFSMQVNALLEPAPSDVAPPSGFEVEQVTFRGGDNLRLSGWYVAPQNDTVVILLHGYGGNRADLTWHAGQLIDAGFGVLMYDLRGHGESDGLQRSYGWADVADVESAVTFLERRGVEEVGVYGFSLGGQVALRAAGQMPELAAVFVDGPAEATAADLPEPVNLQEQVVFRLAPLQDRMMSNRTGVPVPTGVIEEVPHIAPRPIFFVVTGGEIWIPGGEPRLVRPFYEAAGDNATWWEIPKTVHGGGWIARDGEYAEALVTFFSQITPGN